MQKENRVKENWCESVSKELVVFNKAFIRRAGAGLFPFIVLEGNKEAIDYCVTTEAKLFPTPPLLAVIAIFTFTTSGLILSYYYSINNTVLLML